MTAAPEQRDRPCPEIHGEPPAPRRGRRLVGSLAASLALHVGVLAAAVAWGPGRLPLPSIAGQRSVVSLAASTTVYAPSAEINLAPVALPPLDAAIEVYPDHLLIGKRKLVFELPQVELPATAERSGMVLPPALNPAAAPSLEPPRDVPASNPTPRAASPEAVAAAIDRSVGHDDTLVPEGLNNFKPDYPLEAVRRSWSGEVLLQLTVSADGSVEQVQIEQSSGYGVLDAAAVNAARQWRFRPALRWGKAVEYTMRQRIAFKLDGQ